MGLDVVELILKVEEEFGITIENHDAESLRTVGQLHRHILLKLDCGSGDEEVWERLKVIVGEQAGVARHQVTDEKSFVDDFGMD